MSDQQESAGVVMVTGAAGFIGYHVTERLLRAGRRVIGVDNINDYYEVSLKEARLAQLQGREGFSFERIDIADRDSLFAAVKEHGVRRIVHLAAQAGVRYSITNPYAYVESNLVGFLNILEACRQHDMEHLVYASSSSVYGANETVPFAVSHNVDHPVSLYAATKKSNELMAHAYSQLYGIPTTGLRFFTVYGPWGRPDMSPFLFTRAILEGRPLKVFNYGKHKRDFTYIDDIVEGVVRCVDHIATPNPAWTGVDPDPSSSKAPWRVYNIGNSAPVELLDYIGLLEKEFGRKAELELLPMQPGDVEDTFADVQALYEAVGYAPATDIEIGVARFASWYKEFYGVG